MIRNALIPVAVAAAAWIGTAPAGLADATEADVPGMHYDAVLQTPCSNFHRFIFGRDSSGQALACVAFDGEGSWVLSSPLHGVQQIGAPCSADGAAQTPDGRALLCQAGSWQLG